MFGSVPLRKFGKVKSDVQMSILRQFEKENWPEKITPHLQSVDEAKARLDGVANLNKSLCDKSLMHFASDGDEHVGWHLGPPPARSRKKHE